MGMHLLSNQAHERSHANNMGRVRTVPQYMPFDFSTSLISLANWFSRSSDLSA